jgi:hypothetical protein
MYPWALLGLSLALTTAARAQQQRDSCLRYEPDTVQIAGTLVRLTFPGPPNYTSTAQGDRPETYFFLRLARPLCTVGNAVNDARSDVRLVQLLLDAAGYQALRPRLRERVTLRGTLSSALTGHHHAPVLMAAVQLVPAPHGPNPRPGSRSN